MVYTGVRSINPIAWTLYGIIVTQLGQDTTTVRVLAPVYLRNTNSNSCISRSRQCALSCSSTKPAML